MHILKNIKYDQHIIKDKVSCIHEYGETFVYIVNIGHLNQIPKGSIIHNINSVTEIKMNDS